MQAPREISGCCAEVNEAKFPIQTHVEEQRRAHEHAGDSGKIEIGLQRKTYAARRAARQVGKGQSRRST